MGDSDLGRRPARESSRSLVRGPEVRGYTFALGLLGLLLIGFPVGTAFWAYWCFQVRPREWPA